MMSYNSMTVPQHSGLSSLRQLEARQTREWYRTREERNRDNDTDEN